MKSKVETDTPKAHRFLGFLVLVVGLTLIGGAIVPAFSPNAGASPSDPFGVAVSRGVGGMIGLSIALHFSAIRRRQTRLMPR